MSGPFFVDVCGHGKPLSPDVDCVECRIVWLQSCLDSALREVKRYALELHIAEREQALQRVAEQ